MKFQKLANKFMALGLVAAIAVAVPFVPLTKGYSDQIVATEKERVGVAIHRELRQSLQEIQRHRGASTSLLSGKAEFKGRSDTARASADAAIVKADTVIASTENNLGQVLGWAEFKADWQSLKADFMALKPPENAQKHTAVLAKLLEVMDFVADTSELVLDPEAVTYFSMDMAILQLPRVTERMGQGRALGSLVLSEKAVNPAQRDRMISGFGEVELRQNAIAADSKKIFAVDASAQKKLQAPFGDAKSGISNFVNNVQQHILKPEVLTYDPVRYFDETTQAIDASFKLYDEASLFLDQSLQDRVSRVKTEMALVMGIALGLVALIAWLAFIILRRVNRSVIGAANALDRIADGRLDVALKAEGNDEIGHLISRLDEMQNQLRRRLETDKKAADENLRIKIGLDNVATNVMVADNALNIIYMNRAANELFARVEKDLRRDLPNFSAAALLGANIDVFHKNPAHQRALLQKLTGKHRTTIGVGGRTFVLTVTPVLNDSGQQLGTAVEWLDRTGEVAIENEVAMIVTAAANGDFTQRVASEGKEGFFLQLTHNLNQLLDTSQRGIDDVVHVLGSLAKGDLTQRIEADYAGSFGQMKRDANETADHLGDIVRQIKEAADAINTAAKEISSGNQDLSARTEEQASSLEETASSMEELTGTVKQNADNARQANDLAGSAQQVAEKGGEVVGQVVHTMSAIAQSSHKIADIIGVIDGIAFQTNILALNAAVEAARAGEQGRGFAVVATEVRNLAQRSAAAAKEIKDLIADSVHKVESGNKQVEEAGQTMEQIVNSIKGVAKIMAEISSASREQSAGIEQVSLAVSQMDEATQQNAALVEQAAAAAESMEEQALSLAQLVSVFRLAGGEGAVTPNLSGAAHNMSGRTNAARGVASSPSAAPGGRPRSAPQAASKALSTLDDEWHEF
jgi:methyl-accepting chemotaxis protein